MEQNSQSTNRKSVVTAISGVERISVVSQIKKTVTTVEVAAEKNECDGCPYGRYSPCIGWCTKKVLGKGGGGNDGI